MMKFENCTKHPVSFVCNDEVVTLAPSGVEVTVSVKTKECGQVGGVKMVETEYGEVMNLPEPKEGVMYIVGLMVLERLKGLRPDVVAPDTGPSAVRENGQVKYVKQFKRSLWRQGD